MPKQFHRHGDTYYSEHEVKEFKQRTAKLEAERAGMIDLLVKWYAFAFVGRMDVELHEQLYMRTGEVTTEARAVLEVNGG